MASTALPHRTSSSSVTPHIQQPLFLTIAVSTLHTRNGPFMPSKDKVLTGDGDLRFAQVDDPLSVSHSRIRPRSWAL